MYANLIVDDMLDVCVASTISYQTLTELYLDWFTLFKNTYLTIIIIIGFGKSQKGIHGQNRNQINKK